MLTDSTGGGGTLGAVSKNFSTALTDLGLNGPATGGTINGTDVDPVKRKDCSPTS